MDERTRPVVTVEVVYAMPDGATEVAVQLGEGASVIDAIKASGILVRHDGIDLARNRVGIWGRVCALTDRLRDGDRVEIYRPLRADPQALRRARSAPRRR